MVKPWGYEWSQFSHSAYYYSLNSLENSTLFPWKQNFTSSHRWHHTWAIKLYFFPFLPPLLRRQLGRELFRLCRLCLYPGWLMCHQQSPQGDSEHPVKPRIADQYYGHMSNFRIFFNWERLILRPYISLAICNSQQAASLLWVSFELDIPQEPLTEAFED